MRSPVDVDSASVVREGFGIQSLLSRTGSTRPEAHVVVEKTRRGAITRLTVRRTLAQRHKVELLHLQHRGHGAPGRLGGPCRTAFPSLRCARSATTARTCP